MTSVSIGLLAVAVSERFTVAAKRTLEKCKILSINFCVLKNDCLPWHMPLMGNETFWGQQPVFHSAGEFCSI